MDILCYPIGQLTVVQEPTEEQSKQFIESMAGMTNKLQEGLRV